MSANLTGTTSVGSTISVCSAAPATFDAAGYEALTFTKVGEVKSIPKFGISRSSITFTPLETGVAQKRPGPSDPGKLALEMSLNTDNAGQILLKTGLASNGPFSFKVQTQNADVYYFQAIVLSFTPNIGDASSWTTATCELDITSSNTGVSIVEVLAT